MTSATDLEGGHNLPVGWSCSECDSFSLCPDCSGASDALRMWHTSGECVAFRRVEANLRRGDTDYLRWMLRYFDFLERGPSPSIPFSAVTAPGGDGEVATRKGQTISSPEANRTDSKESETQDARESAAASTAAASTTAAAETVRTRDPFESLVANEAEQTDEFKAWARGFARLFLTHTTPPAHAVNEDQLFTTLLRIKVNALGFPFQQDATLGWCVDSLVSKLNHSCRPNCAVNILDTATTPPPPPPRPPPPARVAATAAAGAVAGAAAAGDGERREPPPETAAAPAPPAGAGVGAREKGAGCPPPPPQQQKGGGAAAAAAAAAVDTAAAVKGSLCVVTIRGVAAEEELTISYLNLEDPDFDSVTKRREALREKYLFECRCPRCEEEEKEVEERERAGREEEKGSTSSSSSSASSSSSSPSSSSDTLTRVGVEVPEGAVPGTELTVGVQDARGNTRYLRVPVPPGALPGQQLIVTVDLS